MASVKNAGLVEPAGSQGQDLQRVVDALPGAPVPKSQETAEKKQYEAPRPQKNARDRELHGVPRCQATANPVLMSSRERGQVSCLSSCRRRRSDHSVYLRSFPGSRC